MYGILTVARLTLGRYVGGPKSLVGSIDLDVVVISVVSFMPLQYEVTYPVLLG